MSDIPRNAVLVIGEFEFDQQPFTNRKLNVIKGQVEDAYKWFNYIRAIVVADYPGKFALIQGACKTLFPVSENYGIARLVLSHSDSDFLQIQQIRKNSIPRGNPLDEIYDIGQMEAMAEFAARYNPGPPANDVIIEPVDILLEPEEKLILQRSFHDCERIHIEPIGGGNASMHLFKVHAWLKQSEVGPVPLPFFAKIAGHREIYKEKFNYTYYTDHYISFQYRPNLRLERCVSTLNYSSLVGNFVDDSVPLRSALGKSHHSGIIWSLFDRTLRGFRIQPIVSKKEPTVGLKHFIENTVSRERLSKRDDVIALARSYGFENDIAELTERLVTKSAAVSCLTGPMHGDLHAGNVIVRGTDAILIDFYSVKDGPLTADPINLEISLSFALGEQEKSLADFERWQAFVEEAYTPGAILRPINIPGMVPNELTWLKRSIRELRHVINGCDCCQEETKIVFACYLLRYARLLPTERYSADLEELDLRHRAYALVLADRIVSNL